MSYCVVDGAEKDHNYVLLSTAQQAQGDEFHFVAYDKTE